MALELGGNISLIGFEGKDFTEMIVVKKMVGQYARHFSDNVNGFSGLKVTLKDLKGKSEINTDATINGKEISSSETSHNLYVALDSSLRKVFEQSRMKAAH